MSAAETTDARPAAAPTISRSRYLAQILARSRWRLMVLVILTGWGLWVGQNYLNFDPNAIPTGNEYSSAIQSHHLWTRFADCGLCALWDGSERGGFPAFVDSLGSSLHPLVIVTTLAFGVVNGSKVSLIISLIIAGLAQWWLGGELRLGWPARLWGALMVMVGGHLAGKMELGLFSVVLSTAMVSLTLPAALWLARRRDNRAMVVFAVILALLAVAGQGYMQFGFLAMAPAYLVLFHAYWSQRRQLLRRYLGAAGLALLLAGPFLVPFLHFAPNFVKDGDKFFQAAQPLGYYLLNLFIDDRDFLTSTGLYKLPYPHLYTLFIGWIPFMLAMLCLRYTRSSDRPAVLFLSANALLALFLGSTLPLQWLQGLLPALDKLRFAPMIGGLAVPPLIALASYGLDKLLAEPWPRLLFGLDGSERRLALDTRWLLLPVLIVALAQGFQFAREWLQVFQVPEFVDTLLDRMAADELQWVQPPYGEHIYIEPAVRRGLKLSPGIMTWRWRERDFPTPALEASRSGAPEDSYQVNDADGIPIYAIRGTPPYAGVQNGITTEACRATGQGGWIEVTCNTTQAGLLVVNENNWPGWWAWRDGQRVPLLDWRWLNVTAPAGQHTYLFRYLPFDVPLGILLCLVGIAIAVRFWLKPPPPATATGD